MDKGAAGIMTERLVLRPFSEEDSGELLRLFRDESVRKYLLDDALVTADWMMAEITASQGRFRRSGAGLWSARAKGRPQILGFGGFREFFDPPELQLLYGLLPAFWGRGLATEIAGAVCDHAFCNLGFSQVAAAIDVPNVASRRVLERLGMKLLRTEAIGGAPTAFYCIERGDWAYDSRAPAHSEDT